MTLPCLSGYSGGDEPLIVRVIIQLHKGFNLELKILFESI